MRLSDFVLRLRFLVAGVLLSVIACGMPEKRELSVLTSTPVRTLDPHATDDATTLSFLSNVYEPLVSSTKTNQAVPVLAISWSNPDENTWRFELQKNVRFHDGKAFSAEDVKYTIDRGVNHSESWIKAELPLLDKVRVVDEDTVEIVTRKPFPLLLNNLTRVLIVPVGSERYLSERCNGTGPYRLQTMDNDRAVLQSYADYWKGTPYWSRASFTSNSDAVRRLAAVEQGKADVVDHPPEENLIRFEAEEKVRIVQSPGLKITFLGFLIKDDPANPFRDPNVRKAIALAVDQQRLIDEAFYGLAEKANQLAPPEVFGYSTEIGITFADSKRAKEAMARSLFPNGFRQSLYFGKGSDRIAGSLIDQLRPIGIELQKRELEWSELDALLQAQKAPAYLVQWTFPVKDSGDILYFGFHTKNPARDYGALNFSGISNAALDRILEESASEMKVERRRQLLQEAMKIAVESNAFIPLCIRRNFFAVNKNLQWTGNISGKIILEEIRRSP